MPVQEQSGSADGMIGGSFQQLKREWAEEGAYVPAGVSAGGCDASAGIVAGTVAGVSVGGFSQLEGWKRRWAS